jgi:hypothetical protein
MPSTAPSGFSFFFRDAWNYEVGRCYLASVHRKEDTVVIYRKSTKQLQEWFDHLEETRQAAFLEMPYTELWIVSVKQHELSLLLQFKSRSH